MEGGGVRRIIGVRRSQGWMEGALLRALESDVLVCVLPAPPHMPTPTVTTQA